MIVKDGKNKIIILMMGLVWILFSGLGINYIYAQDLESNLSEFTPEGDLNTENLTPGFKEISGRYENRESGFQIDLPQGWTGTEVQTGIGKIAFVTPNGSDLVEDLTGITLTFVNKSGLATMSNMTNLAGTPLSTNINETASPVPVCKSLSVSQITINGANGEGMILECKDVTQTKVSKAKSYTFVTSNDTVIVLGFNGDSPPAYEQYLSAFEESVKTSKILNPGQLQNSPTYQEYRKALDKALQ